MGRLSKIDLLDIIRSALEASDWNVLYLDTTHPIRLHIYNDEESYRIRVYIWNITSGGRNRPTNEYRIQITGFEKFEAELGGKTLILGWWGEVGVFAGFDFTRHQGVLGASPSLQIREENLRAAYEHGFSPCEKDNQEIAIAFRPEFLVEYIKNLESLHGFGSSQQDFAVLDAVAIDPNAINDSDLQMVAESRRVVITSVQRRLRSTSFRTRVLRTYGYKCAFCGLQLGLVQAAHILPVSHDASSDETHNGIASCFLHHAAYDKGLITFDELYNTHINNSQLHHLKEINLYEGADRFVEDIRPIIDLPPAVADRPHKDYVQLANRIRGWDLQQNSMFT